MAIKVNNKKSSTPAKKTVTVQEKPVEKEEVQTQGNVDLGSLLMKLTDVVSQQGDMIKMMQEKMASMQTQPIVGEVVSKEEIPVLNEDNVASYNREDEEGHQEIIYKMWKIMYVTEQPKITRGMPDAAPMMTTVEEARRVNGQIVYDTKYFNSEQEAQAYVDNLAKKGINLPGYKILSCYL